MLNYPPIPAWMLLERTAEEFSKRIACRYYRQELTYGELYTAAKKTASALARLGVRPGDRVGILLPNIPEYLSVLNGIWMAGGVAVAMSPLSAPAEISDQMAAMDCRTVVALDLLGPLVLKGNYRPDHVLLATLSDRLPRWQRLGYAFARLRRLGFWPLPDSPNQHLLNDRVDAGEEHFTPLVPESLDEAAYILPTGGTTGAPKAVTLSHRNLLANAWQLSHWAGGRKGKDSLLAVLPFFHSYGLSTCAMTGISMAATIIMHHRFVPRIVRRLIIDNQPTIFPAVPAMLVALNDLMRQQPVPHHSLQYCISGGAPLDPQVAAEFNAHTDATVVEGFGLSEASPVTHAGPLDGTAIPGTIGLPLPDTVARIVDVETGRITLPAGQVGELVVRGPQVMLGYWNNPEATAEAIRDGWLHTGDLATCDEQGFFQVVDRKKDMIITSGFNVYPNEVEHTLRRCPAVRDVAIVGVPDGRRGEVVKALVVVEEGQTFDRSAFDQFCAQELAKHKRPRVVELVDGDLPRNFLGKVLRRKLRDTALPAEEFAASPVAATSKATA